MTIKEIYEEIDLKKSKLEPIVQSLNTQISRFNIIAWLFVAIGFGAFIFGIICFVNPCLLGQLSLNELGDYLAGSVASLWSLAGLFFIYVAFLGQKQQLINQQIELLYSQAEVRATRIELEGQKEQLIEQNKTLRQQRFENTFFEMLSLRTSLIENLNVKLIFADSEFTNRGYDAIYRAKIDLEFDLGQISYADNITTENGNTISFREPVNHLETFEGFETSYRKFYFDRYKQQLSHYFRNTYHLFKHVYISELIDDNEKKHYASIIRSHLSSDELFLILYNSLCPRLGHPNFLFLIKELDIMQNFDFGLISKFKFHKEMFDHQLRAVIVTK